MVEKQVQHKAVLQRENKGGQVPSGSASKTSPNFLGPYIRAIESVRAGDKAKAGEELYFARRNIAALLDEGSSSDLDVGTSLIQAGNIMLRFYQEIQPRPVDKIADKMQDELEDVAKVSDQLTHETLKEFIE